MRVQTIYCDRCKKAIKEDPHQFFCEKVDSETGDIRSGIVYEEIRKLDFCSTCAEAITRFILWDPVADLPPQENPNESVTDNKKSDKRTKIDWGKAIALRNAGWSAKEIAEELHTSAAVIAQGFYRTRKKNDKE